MSVFNFPPVPEGSATTGLSSRIDSRLAGGVEATPYGPMARFFPQDLLQHRARPTRSYKTVEPVLAFHFITILFLFSLHELSAIEWAHRRGLGDRSKVMSLGRLRIDWGKRVCT